MGKVEILGKVGGVAQPKLALTGSKTSDPAPPLPTQRKIAAILSAYDDLIEVNTRRIAILEEMARGLYREWFVRFRFPGHERVRMVESAVGLVPEGWEVKALGNIADVNAVAIKKGSEPERINYVDISSVSPGKIDKIEPMPFAEAPGKSAAGGQARRHHLVHRSAQPQIVCVDPESAAGYGGIYRVRRDHANKCSIQLSLSCSRRLMSSPAT